MKLFIPLVIVFGAFTNSAFAHTKEHLHDHDHEQEHVKQMVIHHE